MAEAPTTVGVGTAPCPSCGQPAQVVIDGLNFHLTCDVCLYELWGEATEDEDGREA